ncbi:EmrB/QacA subfamily drug resistance transporter [Agromyces ramosus]|jgi:EmrB/QacA subfamily drug resistance transporter|uniref:EmrB/QacA subfamily drug resistance transporter n=1 Tax=Agromyces ramosus TaxID=33879 RepID=A0A4Q7M8E2_9MICO|nr:MFS transporter [Agromyces ramosus]RZS63417.1 EmrB/QacA subfamily drug resistance transporter [Agromyces ramosus]
MSGADSAPGTPFNFRLAMLLAMAMFVLVVDTSLMNVSISAVVDDLDTTVSGVQGAIALEALVSAAFILIGGKTGDLIGRKLAYILGLLGYAIGAIAMVFAQDLAAIIVFWAVIGGIGASLLLPAMQSLIHGNFEGAQQKRVYALVGASAAIAAAVGPLLGGFITTFLSWRVGFALEAVIIAVVLAGIGLVKDVPYHGDRSIDLVGALLSIVGMGGVVTGILVWQEGGGYVGLIIGIGLLGLGLLVFWLRSRKRRGKPTLLDPTLFESKMFRAGASGQLLQQIALGGTMIVLPIYLQMVFEYNALQAGLSIAPLSLSMFVVALLAGRGLKRRPANIILWGFVLAVAGLAILVPIVPIADSGWYLTIPLIISGCGLGLLVSQLNNYTLSPISDERVSEAAGVNSAAGSFGLSFGLAFAGAIMLATLAYTFTASADASTVLSPEEQQQVSAVLEEDAEIMTNTGLEELLVGQPPEVQEEILRINTDSRFIALQVALLVPILAGLLGILNALRMRRLPDPKASPAAEGTMLG